jgi:hypothetical protein
MAHVLDRPIWSALATRQANLAQGDARARRFPPDIVPFAAARDDSAECLAALAALPLSGEVMVLAEANPLALPPGLAVVRSGKLTQMMLTRTPEPVPDPRIAALTEDDAEEMLALARLTEPGPFTLKAQALGAFFGIPSAGGWPPWRRARTDGIPVERRLLASGLPRAGPGAPALRLRRAPHPGARRDALPARLGPQRAGHPPLRDDRLHAAGDDELAAIRKAG